MESGPMLAKHFLIILSTIYIYKYALHNVHMCQKKTVHTDIIKKHNNISVSLRRLEIEQGSERKCLIIHQGEGREGGTRCEDA